MIALILGLLINTQAMDYTFTHKDCRIRLKETGETKELTDRLGRTKELLEKRNFKVLPFLEGKRVLPEEMYLTLKLVRPKEQIYTSCIVQISLRIAKGNIPKSTDKEIYAKEVKRRVPRITFSGSERCRLALEEAFVHIPTCVKP